MEEKLSLLTQISKRVIRMETLLYKMAIRMGLNPKSGKPLEDDPMPTSADVHGKK